MKIISFVAFLLLGLFFSQYTNGQGWQWGRVSTGGNIEASLVATDLSGNVFVAGWEDGTPAVFGSYTVSSGCAIAKYDASGNILWATGPTGITYPIGITTDQSGNSFLLGAMNCETLQIGTITLTNPTFSFYDAQYFLVKFDPFGNVLWATTAGGCQTSFEDPFLGTGAIATDAYGSVYITTNYSLPTVTVGSYTLTNTDPSGVAHDILLAKYDASGNVVWATSYGGSKDDKAYGLTVSPDGSVYIDGFFYSPSIVFGPTTIINDHDDLSNAFIARFNASGAPVWASSSVGTGGEYALGLATDASNNIYIEGGMSEASIIFDGTTITNPAPNTQIVYLIKFDPDNNVSWYKTIYDTILNFVWGYSIAASPCGTVWINGSFAGVTITGAPVSGSAHIDGHILAAPARSSDPDFIAGFTADGIYIGSAALQSGGDDQSGIACDTKGNVYVCGDFDYYCNPFTVNNDTFLAEDSMVELLYVAKYKSDFYPRQLRDTTLCEGNFSNYTLVANLPANASELWSTGSVDSAIIINDTGKYWVTITDGECVESDTMTLTKEVCDCSAFLPSAFTPNNDGKDDYSHPLFTPDCPINNYSFSIFNRWGERVFYSEDPYGKWDGKYNGVKQELGTYMYYIKYNLGSNNTPTIIKGDVTLIR